MHVEIVLVLLLVHWTEQHLLFPVNFCHMATACIHDQRLVCASTPDGCSRRSFLDQCDMYEYNCDFGTRYQETYLLYCKTSDLEESIQPITAPAKSTTAPTKSTRTPAESIIAKEDSSDYLESEPMAILETISKPTTTNTPCRHTPPPVTTTVREMASTKATTRSISTTSMTSNIIKLITTKPTILTTKPRPTMQVITKKPLLSTKSTTFKINTETTTEFSKCCNRPMTWQTTTENILPVTFLPIDSMENNVIERKIDVYFTEPPITYLLDTNQPLTICSETNPPTTKKLTTSPQTTTVRTTNTPSITYPATDPTIEISTISEKCCNRPLTWLTTTEKHLPVSFFPIETEEMNDSIERKNYIYFTKPPYAPITVPSITDQAETYPPITYPPITDPPKTNPPITDAPKTYSLITYPPITNPPETNPPITDPPETYPPITYPPKTKPSIIKERTTSPKTTSSRTINTAATNPTTNATTEMSVMFTKCCDRPLTWLTTTKKAVSLKLFLFEPVENNDIIDTKKDVRPTEFIYFDHTDQPTTYPSITSPREPLSTHRWWLPPITTSLTTSSTTTNTPTTDVTTTDLPTTKKRYIVIVQKNETISKPVETTTKIRKVKKPPVTFVKKIETTTTPTPQVYDIVKLKFFDHSSTKPSTWWYPTLCPSNKCQRPLTWSTTTKISRRRWRN